MATETDTALKAPPRFDVHDKNRIRSVLRLAAQKAKKSRATALETWFLWDERGVWERSVVKLVERVRWENATHLSDAQIDEALSVEIFIDGARAILADAQKGSR